MPRKKSYLTATDCFCGAGGSSQGAKRAGVEVKMALNHWKLAIETHSTNFPETGKQYIVNARMLRKKRTQ